MFKAEMLTRRDWLKVSLFILLFGRLVFGALYWIVNVPATGSHWLPSFP